MTFNRRNVTGLACNPPLSPFCNNNDGTLKRQHEDTELTREKKRQRLHQPTSLPFPSVQSPTFSRGWYNYVPSLNFQTNERREGNVSHTTKKGGCGSKAALQSGGGTSDVIINLNSTPRRPQNGSSCQRRPNGNQAGKLKRNHRMVSINPVSGNKTTIFCRLAKKFFFLEKRPFSL